MYFSNPTQNFYTGKFVSSGCKIMIMSNIIVHVCTYVTALVVWTLYTCRGVMHQPCIL